mgnify:CR=1 FL=1
MFNYKLARARNQLRYPKLWDGCFAAFCPSQTGPTGENLPNLVGRGDSAVLSDLSAANAWVLSGGYSSIDCPNIGPALTYELIGQPNTDNFSFTCWAKVAATASGNSLCYLNEANVVSLVVNIDDLCPDPLWNGTEGSGGTDLGNFEFLNKWAFFGMSVSSSEDKIWTYSGPNGYVDTPYTTSIENINGTWYLGYGADANQILAQIDDIRFYNRALCQNEMNLLARERGISYKRKLSYLVPYSIGYKAYFGYLLGNFGSDNSTIIASTGYFSLGGISAMFHRGLKLIASNASFSLNGQSAGLKKGYKLVASNGSFSLNGQATIFRKGYKIVGATGSFALSGISTILRIARKQVESSGSFILTGQSTNLRLGKKLTVSVGSFTLTGQSASLRIARKLSLNNGNFVLNGQSANLISTNKLSASVGSFVLTGQSINLRHGYKLTLSAGSFALTGQSATLRTARKLVLSNGSFILNGQFANLVYPGKIFAGQASFILTGQTVNLKVGRKLVLNNGSFTLTGQSTILRKGYKITLVNGSFLLNGQTVNLKSGRKLLISYGSFVLNGQSATLTITNTNRRRLSTRLLCHPV